MIHTKLYFLISNHYAKITEINKPLVACKERKSFQIHLIKFSMLCKISCIWLFLQFPD